MKYQESLRIGVYYLKKSTTSLWLFTFQKLHGNKYIRTIILSINNNLYLNIFLNETKKSDLFPIILYI